MAFFVRVCGVLVLLVVLLSSSLAMKIPFLHRYEPVWYDLPQLSQRHERLARSAPGDDRNLNLQFIAMGRSFDLHLEPDTSIFHHELEYKSSSGPVNSHHLKTAVYTGYDKNTPGSHVHGNMISGVFDGTVYTDNEIYYIEPAHRYARDTAHHSIVYRHSDINRQALRGARCGLSDSSLVEYLEQTRRSMVTPATSPRERRQSRNRDRVRCDLNITGDYRFFDAVTENVQGDVNVKMTVAASLLVSYVQGASRIFQGTNFDDDDDTDDNIQFGIRALVVETTPSEPPFNDEFIGVEAFLRFHSDDGFDRVCLGYRITYRDFDGGVLGLAYVAKQGSAGGICENRFNTGIVTILNYRQRVPTQVTVLTLAHEVGHNFGSEHDPESGRCSPGGSDGNFIMYPFANDGEQRNNNEFSSCSREMMDDIIAARGQDGDGCFSDADNLCKNGFLDDGEQCDCGIDFDEDTGRCNNDQCCNGTSCTLYEGFGFTCSPDQGDCCDPMTCLFLNNTECSSATECAEAATCNGEMAACPEPRAKMPSGDVDYILCDNAAATCVGNRCNGSFCVVLDAESCLCTDSDEQCDVCCEKEGEFECMSTIAIAAENGSRADLLPGRMGLRLPVGSPCNDFIGYCDALNNCFTVDNEGALDRLSELFSSQNLNNVVDFVQEKWWAVLVAGVGLLIGVFVLILVVHLILPRPEHVKARSERRQTIRRSRMKGGGVHPDQGWDHGHELRVKH